MSMCYDASVFEPQKPTYEQLEAELDALKEKVETAKEAIQWLIDNCFDANDVQMIKDKLDKLEEKWNSN